MINSFLRGWVKIPIGGKAREPLAGFGEIPEPTVTVWMVEEGPVVVCPNRIFATCWLLLKNPDKDSWGFAIMAHYQHQRSAS